MRHKFLDIGGTGYHPLRKIRTVWSGLRYAVRYDFSVTYKLVLSSLVLVGAFVFRESLDFLLILVATGMVLFAEMMNSAVEALCDFVEEGHNEKIGVIKDIAAAAVGVSIVVWCVVLGFEIAQMWAARAGA
jgi:diacylglycerol kinase (ATP)